MSTLEDLKKAILDMQNVFKDRLDNLDDQTNALESALAVMQSGNLSAGGGRQPAAISAKPFALHGPNDDKSYRSLFGRHDEIQWEDKQINFFQAVLSGRHHPGLKVQASMSETTGPDGGFLVPTETANMIHAVSLENEIVMPRCFIQPMKSNSIEIPAMQIGDHSSSLFGGFVASYKPEAGTLSEANPKARMLALVTKKLTGLLKFTSELQEDVPGGFDQIIQICGKGLAWYRDKAFLKGNGAGQPLGIINADCTCVTSKEAGQAENTLLYDNLTNMVAHLYPGCFNNSVWICHVSTIPELLTLSLPVGTGGSAVQVLNSSNGEFNILTRPVIFTEKTEPLGTKGDIILADLSQYCVGLRGQMRFDKSIHVGFETDEVAARLIERHDGQPLWNETLTLEDGSTEVSPFVVLEDR